MHIQEVWANVGLDFVLSVWLIVALALLKQVFLVVIFVPDSSETPMELAGHPLSAENILKSFRNLHSCRCTTGCDCCANQCWQQEVVNICSNRKGFVRLHGTKAWMRTEGFQVLFSGSGIEHILMLVCVISSVFMFIFL